MKSLWMMGLGLIVASASLLGQTATVSVGRMNVTATIGPRGPGALPAVAGAPYSGEEVSEHLQVLADGTRFSQQFLVQRSFRDSEGRTRIERPMVQGADSPDIPMMVEINDPVEGQQYTLDTQNKVAHRVTFAKTPPAQRTAAAPFAGQMATAIQAAVSSLNRQQPEIRSERMAPQMIEGLQAEGSRATTIFPTGIQGNDRPFSVITETWTSLELGVLVLSKTSDPRSGDTTNRLTKVSRSEPDRNLFQPPPDYTVVDEKGAFTIGMAR